MSAPEIAVALDEARALAVMLTAALDESRAEMVTALDVALHGSETPLDEGETLPEVWAQLLAEVRGAVVEVRDLMLELEGLG